MTIRTGHLEQANARLDELAELPDGWNGPESMAIAPDVVAAVRQVLPLLSGHWSLFPAAEGDGLRFECDVDSCLSRVAEVYRGPDGALRMYLVSMDLAAPAASTVIEEHEGVPFDPVIFARFVNTGTTADRAATAITAVRAFRQASEALSASLAGMTVTDRLGTTWTRQTDGTWASEVGTVDVETLMILMSPTTDREVR